MALDKATVARIATLARIKTSESEQENLAGELTTILAWIEQLEEVDTTGVERGGDAAADARGRRQRRRLPRQDPGECARGDRRLLHRAEGRRVR
jgi:aspartyl/glutamyl-tRNA(Asn/Gln) amidotransferase C subunit